MQLDINAWAVDLIACRRPEMLLFPSYKLEELAQTVQLQRDVGFEAALRLVQADAGRNYMMKIEAALATMTADERDLLTQRLNVLATRSRWVRCLVLAGGILAIIVLLWAAYLLNRTWSRSYQIRVNNGPLRFGCAPRSTA